MVVNNDGVNCRILRLIKARGLCAGLIRRRRRNPSDSIMNRMGDLGLNLTIALFLFFSSEIDGCKLAAALACVNYFTQLFASPNAMGLLSLFLCPTSFVFVIHFHWQKCYIETFVKTSKPKSLLTCHFAIYAYAKLHGSSLCSDGFRTFQPNFIFYSVCRQLGWQVFKPYFINILYAS